MAICPDKAVVVVASYKLYDCPISRTYVIDDKIAISELGA